VCADQACREAALKKGALRRALGVPIPPDLFGGSVGTVPTEEPTNDEGEA